VRFKSPYPYELIVIVTIDFCNDDIMIVVFLIGDVNWVCYINVDELGVCPESVFRDEDVLTICESYIKGVVWECVV